MIDHIGLSVTDITSAKKFFSVALAPLGYEPLMDFEHNGNRHVGFGAGGKPDFWIQEGPPTTPRVHVAFSADKRAKVDAFHKAALAAGGQDNGAPGLRPHYHEHYYGAFVLDRDGHNIEAVCHKPD